MFLEKYFISLHGDDDDDDNNNNNNNNNSNNNSDYNYDYDCVVPENIHTPPTEDHGNSEG